MSLTAKSAAIVCSIALLSLPACGRSGAGPGNPEPDEAEIGYGRQPESDVTGSVSSITRTDLGANQPTRIDELLRGRVAGLQIITRPEGGYSFRIRGVADQDGVHPEPLFIVDGVQVSPRDIEAALAGLTRDDIKRVDVLKDLSSTAIYGMRGAGGVILITTTRK